MDESIRGFLAQAVRETLALSDIDNDEGYIDSLVSQVDNDGKLRFQILDDKYNFVDRFQVLQAHSAITEGKAGESRLRTSCSGLQTPPASPRKGRGSNRLLQARKRSYAKLTTAEKRKRRKQKTAKPSEENGSKSSIFQNPEINTTQADSQSQAPFGANKEVCRRRFAACSAYCHQAHSCTHNPAPA